VKYKLIALDVDGTLLNDAHELTEATKQTVKLVHDLGATIVLCTGRGPGNAVPVMEELGLNGTVITHNGGATIRTTDLSIMHQYPFEAQDLAYFVHYCREHGIHYDLSTATHLHTDTQFTDEVEQMYAKFMIEPVRVTDVISLAELPVKFTVYSADQELMDRVEVDWKQENRGLLVLRSGDLFIDVMHAEASKGNALRALTESLGIKPSEVLAMGNYYNDADMLVFAGKGIAMANSPDPVKQLADEVTVSNNEGGVYLSLIKHCLSD
jgi:Cof subfamily protein (haloacid dehalogenase superfamily)